MWKLINTLFISSVICGTAAHAQTEQKYWVYLTDKGFSSSTELGKLARSYLSERAVRRRVLRGDPDKIFDESDLPVFNGYIKNIHETGVQIHQKSRWLNAISVTADPDKLINIGKFPFVKKITPVKTFVREQINLNTSSLAKSAEQVSGIGRNTYDYGPSIEQMEAISVPAVHNAGYTGKDILITLIDTGFNYQIHEAFKHLDVLAERDFINNDAITRNEPNQDSSTQHNHGTQVLSLIGGFFQGEIIGPAFGATFAFAKTEFVPSETRVEEDNWIAGIEWADSLGTDVVSTSLGYLDFDDGFMYSYEDLDGQTMVTSIAAKIAVEKGIVVVASAGNEGNRSDWPYVISPAEGLGVLAVGAVRSNLTRVGFSSIGPTADGRIKPDVMAVGSGNIIVIPGSSDGYSSGSGTSFAAPLVAGVCALLLEIHPDWTPEKVHQALTSTASQSSFPDNYYGWGVINAFEAADRPAIQVATFSLYPSFINTEGRYTRFVLFANGQGAMKLNVFNSLGQKIAEQVKMHSGGLDDSFIWNWPSDLASGIYFAKFDFNKKINTQKIIILR